MSFWTDSRNHLLDDLIAGVWFASLSLLIGVPPGQFIGLLIALRLVENLSHANTRLSFGRLGDHLVVGPRYHRWHHALDLPAEPRFTCGCNFAILLPVWDILFGTLYLARELPPTGIHESTEQEINACAILYGVSTVPLARFNLGNFSVYVEKRFADSSFL